MSVMVCGPKGAGKSTFCRIFANALLLNVLTKHSNDIKAQEHDIVAFLDLDPGQPEFSPPGELSLLKLRTYNLGPSFTHPIACDDDERIRAHHFGYLSPKYDPSHYFRCALDLYSHYRRKATCPLIINCSGWIQGGGLELLTDLINGCDLTHVLYMSTTGPEEVVGALEKATSRRHTSLHQLPSQMAEFPTRTAADLRMMSTLSYFHLDGFEAGNFRWNVSPLTTIAPIVVSYAGPDEAVWAVVVLGDEQSPDVYTSLLEGCVVGIVVLDPDSTSFVESSKENDWVTKVIEAGDTSSPGYGLEQDGEQSPGVGPVLRTSIGIPYIRAENHSVRSFLPSSSYSLGQAVIREIDVTNKKFHLLTPIPNEILEVLHRQNGKLALVRGGLDTPTWAYCEQLMLDKGRRLRRERESENGEEYGADDVRAWAERQPWANVTNRVRTGSEKVRRIRRDIRYRNQGVGNVKIQ